MSAYGISGKSSQLSSQRSPVMYNTTLHSVKIPPILAVVVIQYEKNTPVRIDWILLRFSSENNDRFFRGYAKCYCLVDIQQ